MPPRASAGTKKATPKRAPSPTADNDDPPHKTPPTINKEIALAIILTRLDATRDMDWYGLSLDLGASHGVAKEDGGKKRGRKSDEGFTGNVLRDMYYSIILPALKAGKTPWDAVSDIFLAAEPGLEHHADESSRTVRAVQSVSKDDDREKPESTAAGAVKARDVSSALTKKDPNIQTVAPVTPHQLSKRQLDMDDKTDSPKRKRIRVFTSTSKRRFKRESSEEEEWSMSSEEV